MKIRSINPPARLTKLLSETGEYIKLARLRRKLTTEQVCERAGIGRNTLWKIEKGELNVAMGAYALVLFTLGLVKDLLKLAGDDTLARKLQDAGLEIKKREPKKRISHGHLSICRLEHLEWRAIYGQAFRYPHKRAAGIFICISKGLASSRSRPKS